MDLFGTIERAGSLDARLMGWRRNGRVVVVVSIVLLLLSFLLSLLLFLLSLLSILLSLSLLSSLMSSSLLLGSSI